METQEVLTRTKWAVDAAHTEIEFQVKHMMISPVKGTFKEFGADIYTTGEDFTTCEIDFWISPASIYTGDATRDQYLKGPDFFNVERHKKMFFVGETFMKMDKAGSYELFGELTIKGISKKIKLLVVFAGISKNSDRAEKACFRITGLINRSDWGLNWDTSFDPNGLIISDEISINCDLQLVKEKEY